MRRVSTVIAIAAIMISSAINSASQTTDKFSAILFMFLTPVILLVAMIPDESEK